MPEPLALEMVAAYAPEHAIRILDLRVEDDLPGVLADFSPELVGTTALTPEVYAACEVLQTTKEICPDAFTVIGGHHATLLPQPLPGTQGMTLPDSSGCVYRSEP